MSHLMGGLATSHVPAIGGAIAKGLQNDPYWKPFFDGFTMAHEWLDEMEPDTAVIFYNDHGLNFFLDAMPTFAVGAAREYQTGDEGWGIPVLKPFPGDADLSWHIINHLVADEFDITTCQSMTVDHALTIPYSLFWPGESRPVRIVPIAINTVQHPLPSARRCFALGRSVGRAIASYREARKVVVIGTGGLSHQLDGKRAGFINKAFDLHCLEKIVHQPTALIDYSSIELIAEAGAQGVEFLMWLAMRGALGGAVSLVHRNYHIPISNTAAGMIVLNHHPT